MNAVRISNRIRSDGRIMYREIAPANFSFNDLAPLSLTNQDFLHICGRRLAYCQMPGSACL